LFAALRGRCELAWEPLDETLVVRRTAGACLAEQHL